MTKTLMFVKSVGQGVIELADYAGTCGTVMPISAPQDLIAQMLGRQCWVDANWGGTCKILKWESLPKDNPPTEGTSP